MKIPITKPEICLFGAIICLSVFLLGATSNFIAISRNDCRMPVLVEDYEFRTKTHISFMNFSEVKFPTLSDIFSLGKYKFSIGDVLLFSSLGFLFFFFASFIIIKYRNRE
jgi:hypothetical protein